MKTDDLIQVVYPTEVLTNCEQHLSGLEEFANLHAPDLSAEDRVSFGSINETNKLLVNKSQVIMEQNPEWFHNLSISKSLAEILLLVNK